MRNFLLFAGLFAWVSPLSAADSEVTGIRAIHRHGQTFVTWQDVAEGEAGAKFRYSLYRSHQPITSENLAKAQLCYRGVFNNSAKLFGSAFNPTDRLDPAKPYTVLETGAQPLPAWSGLAVHTVQDRGQGYYAVVATDEKLVPVTKIVPSASATTEPVDEHPGPIQPIKLYDSQERTGPYVRNTSLTGTRGLPLGISLHGSDSRGGGAGEYGDYYLYFGTPQMGHRDGLPGVFSITEQHDRVQNRLHLRCRDALEHPAGRNMESYWFGYECVPQWAMHTEPRFYPFTEERLVWMIRWATERYGADPERITMGGSSSGAVGSFNVGMRHGELLAAVFPVSGRVRNVQAVALEGRAERGRAVLMADGQTDYYDRANGPKFAAEHHEDLPFVAWACGRNDGYATWPEQIDMVRALTESHHGFAFAWNNGGHGDGGRAMLQIQKYYSADKFARNRSYPALGNSSLNNDMGPGDVKAGDLEGGINLGFDWKEVVDEQARWSVALSNSLATAELTVDVTPRRCQKFKLQAGEKFSWTSSTGSQGTVTADPHGLVTIERVRLLPGAPTVLTIERL